MDKVAKKLTRVVSASSAGRPTFAFGAATLAKFSDGSCTCNLGHTSVLVTAVSQQPAKPTSLGFVPITVEYKQKAAAAGRIPMTHLRRDIGITESEVLTARMIDRSIRPLFTKGFYNDTQIICNLLAVDGSNDPDVVAINGASACLAISDIPWNGPVGAVRIGLIGERAIPNPSRKEQEQSRMDLVMTANNSGNLIMMDGSFKEPVLLQDLSKAMKVGIKECRAIIDSITKLQMQHGKPKKPLEIGHLPSPDYKDFVVSFAQDKIRTVLTNFNLDKVTRDQAMKEVQKELFKVSLEKFPDATESTFLLAFSYAIKKTYSQIIQHTKIRCDGRQLNEMRPISCKVDLYKPLHGSALFQRGQTQVFCSTTFDSPDASFKTDFLSSLISGIKEKNFMLHYEFPPYATNEIGRVGTMPGRREIGHGALAEKGIRPLVPENNDMTVRLNCEVLESNGSSSMASVCAGSLSLMDAGVNLGEHIAGVAMGLFNHCDDDQGVSYNPADQSTYSILTDILGFEDYIGEMDFKIAGTRRAVTALMLDVKSTTGVPVQIIQQALQRAHQARGEIINIMDKAIRTPRKEKKDNHPVIKTIHVPPHKIASFFGFGGANLKKLMASTGVRISSYGADEGLEIESKKNDNFIIFAPNQDAMQEAEDYIQLLEEKQREPDLEFNGIYTATIQEIRDNGVMLTLYPNMKPTLLHLSQLDIRVVNHPSALDFKVGQQIQVKYFGRDPATGQMRLSRKSLMMSSVSRVHRTPPS